MMHKYISFTQPKFKALLSTLTLKGGDIGCFGELNDTGISASLQVLDSQIQPTHHKHQYTNSDLPPVTQTYNFNQQKFLREVGRTLLYPGNIAAKNLAYQENPAHFKRELCMLTFLHSKRDILNLRSVLPTPLGLSEDETTLFFQFPDSYYTYLDQIIDIDTFLTSSKIVAWDLGRLLQSGIAFQEILTCFHTGERFYTFFPDSFGIQIMEKAINFPGSLRGVVKYPTYMNAGLTGLRDVGDMVFLHEFDQESLFPDIKLWSRIKGSKVSLKNIPTHHKTMHFIAHYHLFFAITIAKRAQLLELKGIDIWNESARLYKTLSDEFFTAFLGSHHGVHIAFDESRFNLQLKFSFTTDPGQYEGRLIPYTDHSTFKHPHGYTFTGNVPTRPDTSFLYELFGEHIRWKAHFEDDHDCKTYSYDEDDIGYSAVDGFGHEGILGNFSGPLPLVELAIHGQKVALLGALLLHQTR